MRILALCLLASLGCAKKESPAPATSTVVPAEKEKPPFREMTLDDVEKRIAQKDGRTFVFDANPKEVYDKRHVPGAVYVPDEGVTASLLPADRSATLIFYCANTH
jgi:hypothetical protein